MKTARAIAAGLVGAAVMSLVMAVLRWAGSNISLEMLLGTLVAPETRPSVWLLGFVLHLAIGGAVAVLYAIAFEFAVQRSGPIVGGALGLAHGLMAGLFMSAIPAMNPLGLASGSAPGAFLMNVEYGPVIFLLLHLLYGAVVGTIYGRPVEADAADKHVVALRH